MDIESFEKLPASEIAQLVRESGPKVCVFPINGTRRWFVLERVLQQGNDSAEAYLDAMINRHIELYQLIFDHGLDTLMTPAFGPDLMERGEDYIQLAAEGLAQLTQHPDLLAFYRSYDVRVRFYGEYRKFFASTPYAYLSDLFNELTVATQGHKRHRLFFGLFANDATETIADLAVRYYLEHRRVPDRRTLVELYYGEFVKPVDLFIGFDKLCVFDMPLIATGNEDLYFTISPSPYMSKRQLRAILYDHLYARREAEPDHKVMGPDDWALMQDFYRLNQDKTLGVGVKQQQGGFWYPLPQVELPTGFAKSLLAT
jgi:tuberculosinol/isotuberculosinol synthase